jgi:hypothetical protein
VNRRVSFGIGCAVGLKLSILLPCFVWGVGKGGEEVDGLDEKSAWGCGVRPSGAPMLVITRFKAAIFPQCSASLCM